MSRHLLALFTSLTVSAQAEMPRVEIAPGGKGFRLTGSEQAWMPWGFNYDHEHQQRLLEDYWNNEWEAVEGDFR
jgi:hypothetical protein